MKIIVHILIHNGVPGVEKEKEKTQIYGETDKYKKGGS